MLAEHAREAEATPAVVRRATFAAASVRAWLKTHWFLATLGAALLASAVSVAHYMVITRPALEREALVLNREAQQAQLDADARADANQKGLDACLASVDLDHAALWRGACEARRARPGCPLPAALVVEHDQRRRDARNECLRVYSLEAR
jgi:hypothetical protein